MRISIIFLFSILSCSLLHSQCEHPDYEALMELYDSTDGENWDNNDGWKEGKAGTACDPCDFDGRPWAFIECENNRVTALDIPENNLSGPLVDLDLPRLLSLKINNNTFSQGLPNFSMLRKLETLEITNSNLTGSIPSFENLVELRSLNLQGNLLEGEIPKFDFFAINIIQLDNNRLSSGISNLNGFDSLLVITARLNDFIGEIPIFESNPSLFLVDLSNNNFSGPVPTLHRHPNGPSLLFFAAENNLSGCIPDSFCMVNSAFVDGNILLPFRGETFSICDFQYSKGAPCSPNGINTLGYIDDDCNCVSFEEEGIKQDFDALMAFFESTNGENWLVHQGWIDGFRGMTSNPCDYTDRPWYGVKCERGRVVEIDLDGESKFSIIGVGGNRLTGSFPEVVMPQLRSLYLDENELEGELPSFEGWDSLETIVCSKNKLEGTLPDFNKLPNLKIFRGSFNNFTGPVPEFSSFPRLNTFTCSSNLLSGCIPESVCDLEVVDLAKNALLPWSGDLDLVCQGQEQIGAPCNNVEYYFININGLDKPIKLLNLKGETIRIITTDSVDISDLPQGLYLLSYLDNGIRYSKRIIKI